MSLDPLIDAFREAAQNNRIQEAGDAAQVAGSAALAASMANRTAKTNVSRLAQAVEQRMLEVEQENAMLSVLVTSLLKHLAQSQPELAKAVIEEVSGALKPGIPTAVYELRHLLELPPKSRTPILDYAKPVVASPKRPRPPKLNKTLNKPVAPNQIQNQANAPRPAPLKPTKPPRP